MEITKKLLNRIGTYNRLHKNLDSLYKKTIDDFKKVGLIISEDELDRLVKNKKH